MNAIRITVFVVLLVALGVAGYFGWRYFFDPAGINIADGEICATNESNRELVFSVSAKPGATVIGLLGKSEMLCAPSPVDKPEGIVMAGDDEDSLNCEYNIEKHGEMPFLMRYHAPGNCDWGTVSR